MRLWLSKIFSGLLLSFCLRSRYQVLWEHPVLGCLPSTPGQCRGCLSKHICPGFALNQACRPDSSQQVIRSTSSVPQSVLEKFSSPEENFLYSQPAAFGTVLSLRAGNTFVSQLGIGAYVSLPASQWCFITECITDAFLLLHSFFLTKFHLPLTFAWDSSCSVVRRALLKEPAKGFLLKEPI